MSPQERRVLLELQDIFAIMQKRCFQNQLHT
jgi:hypothetical protein